MMCGWEEEERKDYEQASIERTSVGRNNDQ